jgi:hypothetical protein
VNRAAAAVFVATAGLLACVPPLPGESLDGATGGSAAGASGGGKDGGADTNVYSAGTALAVGVGQPQNLVVDSGYVYWANVDTRWLMKIPTQGGPPVTLAPLTYYKSQVAVEAANVYWSDKMGTGFVIRRAGLDGTNPTPIVSDPGLVVFAVNRDGIYWITANNALMRADLAGGAQMMLLPPMFMPSMSAPELVADDRNLYWIAPNESGCLACASVMMMPDSGGQPIALMATQDGTLSNLALDPTHVYWLGNNKMSAMRAGIDSRIVEAAWPGQIWAVSFAADTSGLYWTDGAGSVLAGQPGLASPRVLGTVGGPPRPAIGLDAISVYWVGFTDHGTVLWKTPK